MSYKPRIDELERSNTLLNSRVASLESKSEVPFGEISFDYDPDNSEFYLTNDVTFSDLAQFYANGGIIYLTAGVDDNGNMLLGFGVMFPYIEDDEIVEFDGYVVEPRAGNFYSVAITADEVSLSAYS